MPHYAVLQPDKKLAVYSTIVDAPTLFDCDVDEAVEEISQWHRGDVLSVVKDVANGKIPFEFMNDWNHCLAWTAFTHGLDNDTVQMMLERTPDTTSAMELLTTYERDTAVANRAACRPG